MFKVILIYPDVFFREQMIECINTFLQSPKPVSPKSRCIFKFLFIYFLLFFLFFTYFFSFIYLFHSEFVWLAKSYYMLNK